jgi:hypothetical protein
MQDNCRYLEELLIVPCKHPGFVVKLHCNWAYSIRYSVSYWTCHFMMQENSYKLVHNQYSQKKTNWPKTVNQDAREASRMLPSRGNHQANQRPGRQQHPPSSRGLTEFFGHRSIPDPPPRRSCRCSSKSPNGGSRRGFCSINWHNSVM